MPLMVGSLSCPPSFLFFSDLPLLLIPSYSHMRLTSYLARSSALCSSQYLLSLRFSSFLFCDLSGSRSCGPRIHLSNGFGLFCLSDAPPGSLIFFHLFCLFCVWRYRAYVAVPSSPPGPPFPPIALARVPLGPVFSRVPVLLLMGFRQDFLWRTHLPRARIPSSGFRFHSESFTDLYFACLFPLSSGLWTIFAELTWFSDLEVSFFHLRDRRTLGSFQPLLLFPPSLSLPFPFLSPRAPF